MIALLTSRLGIAAIGLLAVLSVGGYAWAMQERAGRLSDKVEAQAHELERMAKFQIAAERREISLRVLREERDLLRARLHGLRGPCLDAAHPDGLRDLLNGRAGTVPVAATDP